MVSNCLTYFFGFFRIKNVGAVIFGVVLGCLITSLMLPSQSVQWVVKFGSAHRNESVFREEAHSVDVTLANKLSKEIRVLCWIMTTSAYRQSRTQHIKDTWGRRCTKLVFMSDLTDNVFGSVDLNLTSGGNSWDKTKLSFEYIHKHHLNDYDWFLKADDDTYVIMENLRYLLHRYSPDHPVYFGFPLQKTMQEFGGRYQIYMDGGAGYAMSREALRRLVERGFADEEICGANKHVDEDVHVGYCLTRLNVSAIDTRDSAGRGTFFPLLPGTHLMPKLADLDPEFKKLAVFDLLGSNCCSDNAISFHRINPPDMHVFDYFIYSLHPYGVVQYPQHLNKMLTEQEMQKIF